MLTKEIIKEYNYAVSVSQFASHYLLEFKEKYPNEYTLLNSAKNKKKKLLNTCKAISYLGTLYFGTLTFKASKDINLVTTKRKEAFKFLNTQFKAFVLVEELGTLKGRYHLHFLGVFNEGKSFNTFILWHSRQNLEEVKDIKKSTKYLVNYIEKQLPRIRRNKLCIKVARSYDKWKNWDISVFKEDISNRLLINIPSN